MQQSLSCSRVRVSSQPEDDIDTLFKRLGELKPPDELVARILTQIRRLPRPSMCPPPLSNPISGGEHKMLLVRNEWRDPS